MTNNSLYIINITRVAVLFYKCKWIHYNIKKHRYYCLLKKSPTTSKKPVMFVLQHWKINEAERVGARDLYGERELFSAAIYTKWPLWQIELIIQRAPRRNDDSSSSSNTVQFSGKPHNIYTHNNWYKTLARRFPQSIYGRRVCTGPRQNRVAMSLPPVKGALLLQSTYIYIYIRCWSLEVEIAISQVVYN